MKLNKGKITRSYLLKMMRYTDTGLEPTTGTRAKIQQMRQGYRKWHLNGRAWLEHRLVYLYHHGWLPQYIDHINNNRADNRIENLRPATKQQNQGNASINKNNVSGYKGVCWHAQQDLWRAYIAINRKQKHLGVFKCKEDAAMMYNWAALDAFGEYAKLNESPWNMCSIDQLTAK